MEQEVTPLLTPTFNCAADLQRPTPDGYERFPRYPNGTTTAPACWFILPSAKRYLSLQCFALLDAYSNLTRIAPLYRRLLTVRTEWSKK